MQDCAIRVMSQEQLPAFGVSLRDTWGNVTGPCEGLECVLTAASAAVTPPAASFLFSPAAAAAERANAAAEALQAALRAAGPAAPLTCRLLVEPSTAPAALRLLRGDDPVHCQARRRLHCYLCS